MFIFGYRMRPRLRRGATGWFRRDSVEDLHDTPGFDIRHIYSVDLSDLRLELILVSSL